MKQRFLIALVLYAVLAAVAIFLLDGKFRLAVLLILGLFVIKSAIALAAGW